MTEAKRQRADMSKGMLSERGTGRAARSFLKHKQPHPCGGKQQGSMAEYADLIALRDSRAEPRFSKAAFGHAIKYDPDGWNPRFDGSGRVVHHVKDGRPLTERGAELLKERNVNQQR